MIREALNVEGPLMGFLNKMGQLIALSVLWLVGCIPIVTIATSTTALYYAVIKSVRREQGNAVKEFLRSYKANILRGIAVTVTILLLGAVLILNLRILENAPEDGNALRWGAVVGLVILLAAGVYICPVLSRFTLKVFDAWKLAFVMAFRFLPFTVVILVGAGLIGALQFYVLPIPTMLLLPGVCCFGCTWPIEKALRRYMPPKEENDNAWYYE